MDNVTDFSEIEGFPLFGSQEATQGQKLKCLCLGVNVRDCRLSRTVKRRSIRGYVAKYGTTDTDDNGGILVISVLKH